MAFLGLHFIRKISSNFFNFCCDGKNSENFTPTRICLRLRQEGFLLHCKVVVLIGCKVPNAIIVIFLHFIIFLTNANAIMRGNERNRPFPSSCLPPLQSESKCEVFLTKTGLF